MPTPRTIISFFSGAMGLDLGLERAGFVLRAVAECNKFALETIRLNRLQQKQRKIIILSDVLAVENIDEICAMITRGTRLKPGSIGILAGAPPCQPFSTAGKRLSLKDERASGFDIMFGAIEKLRPRYFVIENVRGVLSAALVHRPLAQRGAGFPPLKPSEEYGSAFKRILADLTKLCKSTGYCATWGILNAADFGVPQKRERLVIIGARDGSSIWPVPTHAENGAGGLAPWTPLQTILANMIEDQQIYHPFNPSIIEYLRAIPSGGNWRSLPAMLQENAIGGAYHSWGGRSGFLRRLAWNEPSPTITNQPRGRATMLCHPEEVRPLSVQECALIQGFPTQWQFAGGITEQYRQIGNATPVGLGEAIGSAILSTISEKKRTRYLGEVFCACPKLLSSIKKRPRTTLNPLYMRAGASRQADLAWLGGSAVPRSMAKTVKTRPSSAMDGKVSVNLYCQTQPDLAISKNQH